MNARYYNPNTGRFLSQDSYKGSAYSPWTQHLYTYVGNNPVNFIDPTGHKATRSGDGEFLKKFFKNLGKQVKGFFKASLDEKKVISIKQLYNEALVNDQINVANVKILSKEENITIEEAAMKVSLLPVCLPAGSSAKTYRTDLYQAINIKQDNTYVINSVFNSGANQMYVNIAKDTIKVAHDALSSYPVPLIGNYYSTIAMLNGNKVPFEISWVQGDMGGINEN